jgi:hypothetical protein
MAAFPVPQFNIVVGPNTIGPITSQTAVSSIQVDLDLAEIRALQPISPPIIFTVQSSIDNGQSWQRQAVIDIDGLGENRDHTPATRMQLGMSTNIPAGALVRALVESPVAFHSTGGTITVA